jgi:hypothetical protein
MTDSIDWYQHKTWTEDDQRAFFGRLLQSQSTFHKAQYARIQAATLLETGDPALREAARALFQFVVREYPHEESQLLLAHVGQAECCAELGLRQETVEAIAAALEVHRANPRWYATALLTVGRIAVRDRLTEVYEVLSPVLTHLLERQMFQLPADRYTAAYVLAFIADHAGEAGRARAYARLALQCAAMKAPAIPRFPAIGAVRHPSPAVYERLRALAE